MTRAIRPGTEFKEMRVDITLDRGGLGDMIARTPAIRYFKHENPHAVITLYCPNYFLELAQEFYWDTDIRIESIDRKVRDDWDKVFLDFQNIHTSFRTNLTRHAYNVLVNKEVPETSEYFNYPKINFNILDSAYNLESGKYIVITSNYTSLTRKMPRDCLEGLIDYVKEQDLTPVLIGKQETSSKKKQILQSWKLEPRNLDLALDLRDKTSLLQASEIMNFSRCTVGIDNGLIHLAACTESPIVVAFTTVDPHHRKIYRDGDLWKNISVIGPNTNLACSYCQSHMGFIYGHNFKYCYYDDYKCTEQITTNKFITEIENYL